MIGGLCNQCGACCRVGAYKCNNLITTESGRTACAVYDDREPGMQIILRRDDGAWMLGQCVHQMAQEDEILTQLIEQGLCSMEIRNAG